VPRFVRIALLFGCAAAVVAVLLGGCAKKGPTYTESETDFTKVTALATLARADISDLESRPTADGPKLRHEALASLRRQGATASSVADLLTSAFPSDTSGVPVYIEKARYEGAPAVIVVEAAGPKSGSLSARRLWVVGEDGGVLLAGSR
jgi:hypothetical protein